MQYRNMFGGGYQQQQQQVAVAHSSTDYNIAGRQQQQQQQYFQQQQQQQQQQAPSSSTGRSSSHAQNSGKNEPNPGFRKIFNFCPCSLQSNLDFTGLLKCLVAGFNSQLPNLKKHFDADLHIHILIEFGLDQV